MSFIHFFFFINIQYQTVLSQDGSGIGAALTAVTSPEYTD